MGIFDTIPSPYFGADAVPASQLQTIEDLYGRQQIRALPPPGLLPPAPAPTTAPQTMPDFFTGIPGMVSPRVPSFDPMAGVTMRSVNAQPTGLQSLLVDREASAGRAPIAVSTNPLESLTPQQATALAGKMVTIGGGGGGTRSIGITTKTGAPGGAYRQTMSDLGVQQRDALLQKGEAEAQQAKREALAIAGHLTSLKASDDAWKAQQTAVEKRIAEQEARFSAARSEVAAMKVDPDRWWSSQSTGTKVAATISAALSGFVQGFRGQGGENQTVALLNHLVGQDIDAQKAMIAKKGAEADTERGILGDLYRRTGDMRQAEIQARMMLGEGLSTRLKQIAAAAQEPIARQNAALTALGLDQQIAQLKQASLQVEQGDKTTHETRSAGGGGQKVSALQLLQQTALASQGFKTQMAELRKKEATAKGELAELENPSGKTKSLPEGGPVETMRKVNVARDALNQVWKEANGIWTGKRELYGKSPFGSTWKSRLESLRHMAGQKVADATGRSSEEWSRALIGRWDNRDDIRQRLLDAQSALESEVQNSLETSAPKYNVKPFVSLEMQKRQQIRQLYR